jgi:hypothetical protein
MRPEVDHGRVLAPPVTDPVWLSKREVCPEQLELGQ